VGNYYVCCGSRYDLKKFSLRHLLSQSLKLKA
jgi:hypothetical protein